MNIRPLLEEGLEHAVQEQFCALFKVLYLDNSEQGVERFRAGVRKLAETEFLVADMIRKDMALKEDKS
jgi:hypothetical protein